MHENQIISTYLVGKYPFDKYNQPPEEYNTYSLAWRQSLSKVGCNGIVLHNQDDIYDIPPVITYKTSLTITNPIDSRWKVILDYLQDNNDIRNVFCTDLNDVRVLKNPFQKLNKNRIYTGNQVETINCKWMKYRFEEVLQCQTLIEFMNDYAKKPLFNCGIIGGCIDIVQPLIQDMVELLDKYNITTHTVDMNILNYLVYTKYYNKIITGYPINTKFGKKHYSSRICWFAHK